MSKIDIIQEVQQNFIDSSFDVNCHRAFPNVKDGLKDGQRCILWEMYTKKYTSNKPHVKSAKIDGGVAALWWPHGTTAIYETFARMSQPFTNNVPEIDFHGANGNIILGGDAIAADRYTEARLSSLTEDYMLKGVDKNTVPMTLNFSEDEYMPKVLPSVFPRLLVNGAQGIGVSVANTWLPHSLSETCNLVINYLKTNELNTLEYYPDFPTGGTIINKDELSIINKTGKGKVILQANYKIENKEIIFYEMPYQVYIEPVIEKIKEQIEKEELVGIKEVFNKSDKKNIALVIECKNGYKPEKVIEQLFQQTPLRSQYNANQNGIISKTPVLLNLQQTIDVYVKHNLECIKKEHQYDLDEANARIEILNGLSKALIHIDEIILIIKESENSQDAKEKLSFAFGFTENQTKAILEMRLSKLTKLDGVSINKELDEKKKLAEFCNQVVDSQEEQKKILLNRLEELVKKYGTPRRTKVIQKDIVKVSKATQKKEEVIESVVVTYNSLGYLQRIPISMYKNGNLQSFKLTTADFVILFSNLGKFYRISVKDIKSCGVKDKGTAIGSIIKLDNNEKIIGVFSSIIDEKHPYILFAMKNGYVKKTEKFEYIGTTRNLNGMVATKLKDTEVISVQETNGNDIILETSNNYTIRFSAEEVRESGKASLGVKGITLQNDDEVVKCRVINKGQNPDIIKQKRGGKGKKC